jgi:hypothetical protein
MDVSVASYDIERKTIKVAKCGTPKKIFNKTIFQIVFLLKDVSLIRSTNL